MKTLSILALFALASVSLVGCALAPDDVNADGTPHDPNGTDANTTVTTVGKAVTSTTVVTAVPVSTMGDVTTTIAPPTPVVVGTVSLSAAPVTSPGTLVSCLSFDVATDTTGATIGVCAATTAAGKPRYLRAYSIVSISSPVTGENVSTMVGFE